MYTAAILLSILIAAQSVICVALDVETRGLEARVPGCTTVKTGFLVADKSGPWSGSIGCLRLIPSILRSAQGSDTEQ